MQLQQKKINKTFQTYMQSYSTLFVLGVLLFGLGTNPHQKVDTVIHQGSVQITVPYRSCGGRQADGRMAMAGCSTGLHTAC